MALLSIIRRWHIRDQVPLREIARRLRISRNTVRRYLRAEITEPAYAVRRSRSAIDKYAFQLSAMLKTEAARSRKQRRTLKQIHEDLRQLGFEGSYDRVAAFARVWREGQTERVNPSSKRTGSLGGVLIAGAVVGNHLFDTPADGDVVTHGVLPNCTKLSAASPATVWTTYTRGVYGQVRRAPRAQEPYNAPALAI